MSRRNRARRWPKNCRPRNYHPESPNGLALLGHELAHVVQQREGKVVNPFSRGVAWVQDPRLEAEAERVSRRVVRQLAPELTRGAAQHPAERGRALQRMIGGVHHQVTKVTQTRNYDCVYACVKMLLDFHGIPIPNNSSLVAFHGGQDVRFGVEHLIPVAQEFGLVVLMLHDHCNEYRASDLQRVLATWGPIAAGLVFGRKDRNSPGTRQHMVVIDGIRDVYVSTVDPVPDNESPMQGIGFTTLLTEVDYFLMPLPRDRQDLIATWSGKLGRLKCEHAMSQQHQLGW